MQLCIIKLSYKVILRYTSVSITYVSNVSILRNTFSGSTTIHKYIYTHGSPSRNTCVQLLLSSKEKDRKEQTLRGCSFRERSHRDKIESESPSLGRPLPARGRRRKPLENQMYSATSSRIHYLPRPLPPQFAASANTWPFSTPRVHTLDARSPLGGQSH